MTVRIANAQAFWGDDPRGPRHTLDHSEDLDYLTLDYLAEVTMTVLARQHAEDSGQGYATTFPRTLRGILADTVDRDVTVIANAGGVNPGGCREAVLEVADEIGVDVTVGTVFGDDFRNRIDAFDRDQLMHAYKDRAFPSDADVLSANAYFGGFPIASAIEEGADVVVTGRVLDAAMTMGPLIHEYGWSRTDYDRLGRGMMAGHVIECGAQATGGNYHGEWQDIEFENIGFPIAAVESDGSTVITKPAGTGGKVTEGTVAEQLLYETADPANYYGPDVIANFERASLESVGEDRVRITGVTGHEPTDQYKASLHYQDGYQVKGSMVYSNPFVREKAERVAESIKNRADDADISYDSFHVEYFGDDALHAGQAEHQPEEIATRIAIKTPSKGDGYEFGSLFATMGMAGPPGVTMFTSGRPTPSPNYAYHPVLLPKDAFDPQVEVVSA